MAFHPSDSGRLASGADYMVKPNAKWRCGTCGQVFTAEQLRADKRAHSKVAEQT